MHVDLVQNVELLFETSSANHMELEIWSATVSATQPKTRKHHEKHHQNNGKCDFCAMGRTCPPPTNFSMDFLEPLVLNHRPVTELTRAIQSLSQNELMQLEFWPNNWPIFINLFGTFLVQFPIDVYFSRVKCRITLWDQLYESCGIGNLIRDSARSATESTQNTTKNVTNSMENAILVPWAGPVPRLQWIFWNLWCWTTDPLHN